MINKMKLPIYVLATILVVLALVTAVFADNLHNSLEANVDSITLTPGSPSASQWVSFYVQATGGDGDSQCNFDSDSEILEFKINTPAGVSAEPDSLTFNKCHDGNTLNDQSVLFTATQTAVSGNVTFTEISNNTGGSFDYSKAGFQIIVPVLNTAPTISISGVANGASYEIGAVPAAVCEVTDDNDNVLPFLATLSAITGPLSDYGLGELTAFCEYTDAGGLTANASVTYNIVDTTAPEITFVNRTPAANLNGWNNSDVTVTWTCSDSGSGVVQDVVSQTLTDEGADQSTTGTCTDRAGNTASDTQDEINIDKTAPSVSLVGGPADGAEYYFGNVPPAPNCSASDTLSGVDGSCSVSGYAATVGSHTVTATATDKAGNPASASASYTVLAWTLNGFYRPVDMGITNTVKGGSTVPLKFEVFAGPNELTDVGIVSAKTQQVMCIASPEDPIELVATGGTSLRYDIVGGQFIFNWQTPKSSGACYKVTITTMDGSSLVANFSLK